MGETTADADPRSFMTEGDSYGSLHWIPDKAAHKYTLLRRGGMFLETKYILPRAHPRKLKYCCGPHEFEIDCWTSIIENFERGEEEDIEGYMESAARIKRIIDAEVKTGICPANIFVGGCQQGAALAFTTALRYNATLGGIVSLSGYIPMKSDYPRAITAEAKATPVLHYSRTSIDCTAHIKTGQAMSKFLQAQGMRVQICNSDAEWYNATSEFALKVGAFMRDESTRALPAETEHAEEDPNHREPNAAATPAEDEAEYRAPLVGTAERKQGLWQSVWGR